MPKNADLMNLTWPHILGSLILERIPRQQAGAGHFVLFAGCDLLHIRSSPQQDTRNSEYVVCRRIYFGSRTFELARSLHDISPLLGDPRFNTKEEMDTRYARVAASALYTIGYIIGKNDSLSLRFYVDFGYY